MDRPQNPPPSGIALNEGAVWEPASTRSWARVLGLVHVPLFGFQENAPPGEHAVLLDGFKGSFAMSSVDEVNLGDEMPLSWSWSSNLHHILLLDRTKEEMYLRRWDSADRLRRFEFPQRGQGAIDLLGLLEAAPAPRAADVILHLLRLFRQIRAQVPEPLCAIQVFNLFLLGTEAVQQNSLRQIDWFASRTVQDLVGQVPDPTLIGPELPRQAQKALIGDLPKRFLDPEPLTGCRLKPALLLRHAASQLYQEAHLVLERDGQLCFPGLAEDRSPIGTSRRDIRFTPAGLARALVQQSLKSFCSLQNRQVITVLDPACGSGIFLLEALRELASIGYRGTVVLRGFDISEISCVITRFCLQRLSKETEGSNIKVRIEIEAGDALQRDWGKPDLVLMNPPFVAWLEMDSADREIVKNVLQDMTGGRPDKAMAFVWLGARALAAGGVMASVIPAALLATQSGAQWRESLRAQAEPVLIGRFESLGYFQSTMVAPAFIVLKQGKADEIPSQELQQILAKEGYEDIALRTLRLDPDGLQPDGAHRWEVFKTTQIGLDPENWAPVPFRERQLRQALGKLRLPQAQDLFDVMQGLRTGHNAVFIVAADELKTYPAKEHRFFRPIASNSTIRDGQLLRAEFVFYPYGPGGILLHTEEELRAAVPTYLTKRLLPAKPQLAGRQRVGDKWWQLAERRAWQQEPEPKLASTYFGDRGSFAYDEKGDFVVLQGWAWRWKNKIADTASSNEETEPALSFHESVLPYAYLALLNSSVVERVLANYCSRVQGGQFNLSKRFVDQMPLPDLSSDEQVDIRTVEELSHIGRKIHRGRMNEVNLAVLDQLSLRAYGIPEKEWREIA